MKKIKLLTGLVSITGLTMGLIPVITGCVPHKAKVESLVITTKPTKTTYTEGEKLDLAGMVVTATRYDGTTEEVKDYTVSPKTTATLKTTDTKVKITYEGKTAEFAITVNPAATPVELDYEGSDGYHNSEAYDFQANKKYICWFKATGGSSSLQYFWLKNSTQSAKVLIKDISITINDTTSISAEWDETKMAYHFTCSIAVNDNVKIAFTVGDTAGAHAGFVENPV